MCSKAPCRVAADLDVIPFASESPPADLDWVRCAHCRDRLAPHQPDLDTRPGCWGSARVAGVGWYLVLVEPGLAEAMMVVVPENRVFQAA